MAEDFFFKKYHLGYVMGYKAMHIFTLKYSYREELVFFKLYCLDELYGISLQNNIYEERKHAILRHSVNGEESYGSDLVWNI